MLCTSLMPASTDAALDEMVRAAESADAVELRLDAMDERDLERLLASPPCPVIVTCRPVREGGLWDGPENERLALLRRAADLGADYVDVEHDAIAALGPVAARRIVSFHDPEGTPDDLPALHARLAATGADVVKIAVTARHILDTVPVLRLLRDATVPTIALSMGERGVLTRVLARKFGAFLTFGAFEGGGREAAPGQVTARLMRERYRAHALGPATDVYGVIADPVGHSLSPQIHNAAFAALGLDAVYLPLWVEGDAARFVPAMREFDFAGYSVTIPHKQSVMAAMDEIEPLARRIGAINTVQRRGDGSLFGTNTDWTAGMASIEAVVGEGGLAGKRALVLGAGGVGRAMAFGLAQRGAEVMLSDVDTERAEALASETGAVVLPSKIENCRVRIDLLLNCTPVGMHPETDASPVPASMLTEDLVVYDAVYNPAETRLLREARAAGGRTVRGLDHFLRQAVEQFELWTGRAAPADLMRETVVDALGA